MFWNDLSSKITSTNLVTIIMTFEIIGFDLSDCNVNVKKNALYSWCELLPTEL